MNLFIEVKDGKPINHPAVEPNLLQVFGHIPSNWEPFNRIEKPGTEIYEVFVSEYPVYEKVNGVWSDVWHKRPMTDEEKKQKQNEIISSFNNRPQSTNWSAWTLDEETCTMVPPIPRPPIDEAKRSTGILTVWCGAENNWKDTPVHPQDGNPYRFDFFAWQWVPV